MAQDVLADNFDVRDRNDKIANMKLKFLFLYSNDMCSMIESNVICLLQFAQTQFRGQGSELGRTQNLEQKLTRGSCWVLS